MKKIIFVFLILGSFLWKGCDDNSFDYQMYVPDAKDVDSVYFSTGTSMLIADGQATLDFIVEAYRKVKMTNEEGRQVDSIVTVDVKTLPAGSVKLYRGTEEIAGSWSTTDATPGTVTFFAKVGERESAHKTVVLRSKPALPQLKYVDVIFHVFELKKTDSYYDPLTYQTLDYGLLQEAVRNMNDVFNNKVGKGPNGASANIVFRMAAKNPSGVVLQNPGYNRTDYDKSSIPPAFQWGYDVSDFIKYVNANASRIWDPQRYLNIVVMPSGANMSMGTNGPQWQVLQAGGVAIPGIAEVVPDFTIPKRDYANTCVGVPQTLFRPGMGRKVELYPFVGAFYGLKRTDQTTLGADYCTDTQLYDGNLENQYDNLKKIGLDGEKFLSSNAMDNNRFPSLRNNFTLDQITRIRQVMANCPGRNNGLDQ